MIEFGSDWISITDENDNELLYWDKKEWEENSEIVFSICNAIRIYYEEGVEEIKSRLESYGRV